MDIVDLVWFLFVYLWMRVIVVFEVWVVFAMLSSLRLKKKQIIQECLWRWLCLEVYYLILWINTFMSVNCVCAKSIIEFVLVIEKCREVKKIYKSRMGKMCACFCCDCLPLWMVFGVNCEWTTTTTTARTKQNAEFWIIWLVKETTI